MPYLPADSPSARGFQQQHRNSSTYPSCDFKALHLCKYRSHAFIPNFLQCHYPYRQPFMTAALSVKQVRLECCQKPLEQSFSFHLNSDKCISVPKRKKKYSSKTLQKFLIIFFSSSAYPTESYSLSSQNMLKFFLHQKAFILKWRSWARRHTLMQGSAVGLFTPEVEFTKLIQVPVSYTHYTRKSQGLKMKFEAHSVLNR